MALSGIVFWGFVIPDDVELPWEAHDAAQWQDHFATVMELKPPEVAYEGNEEEYHTYYDQMQAAVVEAGCEVDATGDHEWAERPRFVHVTAGQIYASAPQVEPLDAGRLEVKPEWNAKLKSFCELMGIPFQEPGWYLTSANG